LDRSSNLDPSSAFAVPLRGSRRFLAGNPRIALRFIRGYYHCLPPGANCGVASGLRQSGLIVSHISKSRCAQILIIRPDILSDIFR
jgi:hypothetical protein